MTSAQISIRPVRENEIDLVLEFIRELAEYEHLSHEVSATADNLRLALFGPRPQAEAVMGCIDGQACGFALFFHNFSTFLGKPGLYLEDLYVRPAARGRGLGSYLLAWLARLALDRGRAGAWPRGLGRHAPPLSEARAVVEARAQASPQVGRAVQGSV